jgi:hypothetical protein
MYPAGLPQQAAMPSQHCQAKWAMLSLQLSPFNVIIAIEDRDFMSWNVADQEFIVRSYM